MSQLSRSAFLRLLSGSILFYASGARSAEEKITKESVYTDPDAPIGGNPAGDLTIVDFFDYNCPFCKRAAIALEKLAKADGKIKIVYRDWPILTEASVVGAFLALAAKSQGRYLEVHNALMNLPGSDVSRDQMLETVRGAGLGLDLERLDSDLQTKHDTIRTFVKRNLAMADAIGFQGTPGFLIGPYKVNEALTYEGFQRAAADARKRQRG